MKLITDNAVIEREVHSIRTTTSSGTVHRFLVGEDQAVDRAIVSHAMTLELNDVNYWFEVPMNRVLFTQGPDLDLLLMHPCTNQFVYARYSKGGYFVPDAGSFPLLARLQGSDIVQVRLVI